MTKRLYYADSYLKEFSGIVLDRCQIEKKPAVVLDQTAFYPESGGQPHDTGFLGEARVIHVVEDDTENILHLLDRELPPGSIAGRIDWARRFDHMQQHTGQHILSQAFLAVSQARTLSFHMGQETSTIDIEMTQPSVSRMEEAQALAMDIVFQNRPVHTLTTSRDELSSLGVRKESHREGEIRVIDVDGFDRSPCGGTHVRNTGEIGLIFISGFERYKGGIRVEFVAGGRALQLFQKEHELLKRLGSLYSATPDNIPDLTEKLLQERMNLSRDNEHLREQLLETEADQLLENPGKIRDAFVVWKVFNGRSLESIKSLAQKIVSRPRTLAILAIGDACQIVVARSKDLPGSCNDAVKRAISGLGGKGGGRPELAQAGGFSKDAVNAWLQSLEEYFTAII
jgi:alanyl-tRNA synthetase